MIYFLHKNLILIETFIFCILFCQGDDVDSPDGRYLKGAQTIGVAPAAVPAAPRRRHRRHSSDSRGSDDMSSSCSVTASNESAGEAHLIAPRGRPPGKDPGAPTTPTQPKHRKRKRRTKDGRTVDTVNTALVSSPR